MGGIATEGRVDAVTGLIVGPQLISKRLDDVIGGNTDVGAPSSIICRTVTSTPFTAPNGLSWPLLKRRRP